MKLDQHDSSRLPSGSRQERQFSRQKAITEAVMTEGTVRIESLAQRFDISVMTVHRDLDELESRGLLRKHRGVATALSTALVESSDVFRSGRQLAEKESLAQAALDFIEPGQAILLDDSTTALQLAPLLHTKAPLTVITNTLPLMEALRGAHGISLLGLGGEYYNWCSAFMGHLTTSAVAELKPDLFVMSTSAIVEDVAYHQVPVTVDLKRAMFTAANTRLLLADHTKFERRALHAMMPLKDFDAVIVDDLTHTADIERLRNAGVNVVIANPSPTKASPRT